MADTMKSYGPDLPAPIHGASAAAPNDAYLRALMYALQAIDAQNSAQAFAHGGEHETNPTMKPFSHGGAPMMALGFGLGDFLRDRLLRHASPQARTAGDGAQALTNIMGIMQTNAARRPL